MSATAAATACRSCPFGVVAVQPESGLAQKCTLCYDRQKDGLEPACAKACPTDSITFGPVDELRAKAEARVEHLRARGKEAHLYGVDGEETREVGPLNAFFLLPDRPEVFNLPLAAGAALDVPAGRVRLGPVAAAALALLGARVFRGGAREA